MEGSDPISESRNSQTKDQTGPTDQEIQYSAGPEAKSLEERSTVIPHNLRTLPTPGQQAAVMNLQRSAGNRAVNRILKDTSISSRRRETSSGGEHAPVIQRKPAPASSAPAGGAQVVPRNEVDLMATRFKMQQIDLQFFLSVAKTDVDNIRNYFTWLNDVYKRVWGHHSLVIAQARASAETEQKWFDFVFGIAVGISIGVFSEALIAGAAAEAALELVAEAGAEVIEGIVGAVKPEIPKAKVIPGLAPEFAQVVTLTSLDRLNTMVLSMAVPGPMVYTDAIIQCERISAALLVAEAGGPPPKVDLKTRQSKRIGDDLRMPENGDTPPKGDMEIREKYLKLMQFSLRAIQLDQSLKEAEGKFNALRAKYMGKQPPSDARFEQDLWIFWLANQDINTFFAPTLYNEQIRRHLVDIGLAGLDHVGGRLNIKIGDTTNNLFEPRASEINESTQICKDLQSSASAVQAEIPAFWRSVFFAD